MKKIKASAIGMTGKKQCRILGKNIRKVSFEHPSLNGNMLVIGAERTFKKTALMYPNILQMESTYVILDVNGCTQRKFGKAFLDAGYCVRSLNLKEPEKSDRYNPFVYIETEDDLIRQVKVLQNYVRPMQSMNAAEPFWEDGVRLYLQALFYYEWLDSRENNRVGSMNGIVRLVNLENQHINENTTRLQQLMDKKAAVYGEDYPPVRDYRKLKESAPDTVRSIFIMVNAMLTLCETAEMRRIFSGNDIDIRALGTGVGGDPERKTILFLVIPDNNNVYNFLISMFYTQMFDILVRLSEELHAPLPCHVEVWMDQFYMVRPIDAGRLMAVNKGRNISMIPVVRSFSQLKTICEEDGWSIPLFEDCMEVIVYFGCPFKDQETSFYISEKTGGQTIQRIEQDGRKKGMAQKLRTIVAGKENFKAAGQKRFRCPLLETGKTNQTPITDCMIFLKGQNPIYAKKAIPFDIPECGYKASGKWKTCYQEACGKGSEDT